MGEELKRRHGDHILEQIRKDNLSYKGKRIEEWVAVDKVATLRPDLVVE
jgi:hypothetical protein